MLFLIFIHVAMLGKSLNHSKLISHRKFNKSNRWAINQSDDYIWSETPGEKASISSCAGTMEVIGELVIGTSINIYINNRLTKSLVKQQGKDIICQIELLKKTNTVVLELIHGKIKIRGARISLGTEKLQETEINDGVYRVEYFEMSTNENWHDDKNNNGEYTSTINATKCYEFYGTKVMIYGYNEPNYGVAQFYLDDNFEAEVSTNGSRAYNVLLWSSNEIPLDWHVVKVVCKSNLIGLNYLVYHGKHKLTVVVDYKSLDSYGYWYDEPNLNGTWTTYPNSSKALTFYGTAIYVYGYLSFYHGWMDVYLDSSDTIVYSRNTFDPIRQINVLLYKAENLTFGRHYIKVQRRTEALGLNRFVYTTKDLEKMFEYDKYVRYLGQSVWITAIKPNSTKESTIFKLETFDGSAVHGIHYIEDNVTFKFDVNETEKLIEIKTIQIEETEERNYTFSCRLDVYEGLVFIDTSKPTEITLINVNLTNCKRKVNPSEMYLNGYWAYDSNGITTGHVGSKIFYEYNGSKLAIYGSLAPNNGILSIRIDNSYFVNVSTKGGETSDYLLFVYQTKVFKSHNVTIECLSGLIGINYFKYDDKAIMFGFVKKDYSIIYNSTVFIEIERSKMTNENVILVIDYVEETAKANQNFLPFNQNITFYKSTSLKKFRIYGVNQKVNESTHLTFKARISSLVGNGIIGNCSEVTIKIFYPYYPEEETKYISYDNMNSSGLWTSEHIYEGGYSIAVDSTRYFSFFGVKAFLYGYISSNHGIVDFYLDGEYFGSLDTGDNTRLFKILLFATPDLKYGYHTVMVKLVTVAVGINFATYISQFEATKAFSTTTDFTISQNFLSSLYFEEPDYYFPTNDFNMSKKFSISIFFDRSKYFIETSKFTLSYTFAPTKDFKPSTNFIPTLIFAKTGKFTSTTTDFTISPNFLSSLYFEESDYYFPTNDFNMSKNFSISIFFDRSKYFIETSKFTLSYTFAPTKDFKPSTNFIPTLIFAKTGKFTSTKNFIVSHDFTGTNIFSYSNTIQKTSFFVNTELFGKTTSFSESLQLTLSNTHKNVSFNEISFINTLFLESNQYLLSTDYQINSNMVEKSQNFRINSELDAKISSISISNFENIKIISENHYSTQKFSAAHSLIDSEVKSRSKSSDSYMNDISHFYNVNSYSDYKTVSKNVNAQQSNLEITKEKEIFKSNDGSKNNIIMIVGISVGIVVVIVIIIVIIIITRQKVVHLDSSSNFEFPSRMRETEAATATSITGQKPFSNDDENDLSDIWDL